MAISENISVPSRLLMAESRPSLPADRWAEYSRPRRRRVTRYLAQRRRWRDVVCSLLFDVHMSVMPGDFPEHTVSGELEHRRQPVVVRRLEIQSPAVVVRRSTSVNMVVCRHKRDGFGRSSRPDISQGEHPQRFA